MNKITEIIEFNPKRTLKKTSIASFIEMSSLSVGVRNISKIGKREFKGGGSKFQNGDTLFARITPCLENGKTAKVSGLDVGEVAHGSTEFIVMSAKEPEFDEDFIYYIARLPEFRAYAQSRMEGTSGRQRVPWQSLSEFKLNIPIRETRKKIGYILKRLDDKIILNHQINQTLEQIAQALFKSWFVDFDPVKAKMTVQEAGGTAEQANLAAMQVISGKTKAQLEAMKTQQPEQYKELKATAELFPDAMQESELGDVPVGWGISEIGKEVTVVGGGTPSTKNPDFWKNGTLHWTTPKDLSNLSDRILIETSRKVTEKGLSKISSGLLPINTVLMSSRAPVGYLALAKIPVAVNQGYIAMKCEKTFRPEYVIQWCDSIMNDIKQRASGTTFAEISKKNFKVIPLLVPSQVLIKNYSDKASNLYLQVENNLRESQSLTQLRDTLLPKLLSGELNINIEEAAK